MIKVAIIPCYNEERTIIDVVGKVKRYVDKVIVIDDGSKDETTRLAREAGAIVLRHATNIGKGGALRTGFRAAELLGADAIVTLDGDGQHEPQEIVNLFDGLKNADIVIGVRKPNERMPGVFKLGNVFLNALFCNLFGLRIKDTQSGFRAFNECYKRLKWGSNDYRVETEVLTNINKYNLRYKEIAIDTVYNDAYKGTTVLDGIRIALSMILWRLKG